MSENFFLETDIKEICNNIKYLKKNLSGKKFIISGANGFLGKYFIKSLLEINKTLTKKIKILAIDIKFDNCEIYKDKNVKKLKQNINSIKEIRFKGNYVLHAAGIPSPKHYYNKPIEAIFTSITGTKKLLEYSKKHNSKFIFFSSSEIYGNPDIKNIPTKETYEGRVSSISDRSCYDESKRAGETYTYIYRNLFKLNCKIVRPFNFYGNGMKKNDKRVIPQFFYTAIKKKKIFPFSNGNQTRAYCHIIDAIPQIINVCFLGKKFVYNIGNSNEEISAYKLAKKIKKVMGEKSIKIKNIAYPKNYPSNEPLRRCPDISNLKNEFNYIPSIKVIEGLKMFKKYAKREF